MKSLETDKVWDFFCGFANAMCERDTVTSEPSRLSNLTSPFASVFVAPSATRASPPGPRERNTPWRPSASATTASVTKGPEYPKSGSAEAVAVAFAPTPPYPAGVLGSPAGVPEYKPPGVPVPAVRWRVSP